MRKTSMFIFEILQLLRGTYVPLNMLIPNFMAFSFLLGRVLSVTYCISLVDSSRNLFVCFMFVCLFFFYDPFFLSTKLGFPQNGFMPL